MSIPLGPMDLARRAIELHELLDTKADTWPQEMLDALRGRVREVESAALDAAVNPPAARPATGAESPPLPRTPPPTATPAG